MSNPFDDLTLGEVEVITTECLLGPINDETDSLQLAGAVMYMHARRSDPELTWVDFKNRTRMADIKSFSALMNDDDEETPNPTNGVTASHA